MLAVTKQVALLRVRLVEPHLREMLIGSLAGLTVKVLAALSLFAMNVAVTRTMGASEAGLFFFGFTLVTIAATAGRLGLDQVIVRFIATEKDKGTHSTLHKIYRSAVLWTLSASLIFTAGLWLSADWLNHVIFGLPNFTPTFQNMVLAVPVVAIYIIHAQALQGLKRISQSMLVSSVFVPTTVLALVFIAPTKHAYELSLYFIAACLLTALLGRLFWTRSVTSATSSSAPNATQASSAISTECKETTALLMRKACAPLWTVAIVHLAIQWSSQLILGVWEDAQAIAFFATAQRTAMLTSFALFAVNTIAAPKFAVMHSTGDMAGLKRMALISVRLMLVVALPITLFIFMFPEWIMSLFGDEFKAASQALIILAVGQFINIATGSVGYLLSMTGHERSLRDNILISGMISVVLGLTLIPLFGVIGAATAYACGVASQNLLGVYQVKKYLGFNTLLFWKS